MLYSLPLNGAVIHYRSPNSLDIGFKNDCGKLCAPLAIGPQLNGMYITDTDF